MVATAKKKYNPNTSIAELRARNGKMTQREFGDTIGVSATTVSSWEKNIYSIRSVHLIRICEKYNVSSEDILGI